MDCHFLLHGIFLTQGSDPGLLNYRQTLYHLSHQGSTRISNKIIHNSHYRARASYSLWHLIVNFIKSSVKGSFQVLIIGTQSLRLRITKSRPVTKCDPVWVWCTVKRHGSALSNNNRVLYFGNPYLHFGFLFFFLRFFLMWTIYKVFIESVTIVLLFHVLVFSGHEACGILARPTRGSNLHTPCIGRWSLNHWTTREVPLLSSHPDVIHKRLAQHMGCQVRSWSYSWGIQVQVCRLCEQVDSGLSWNKHSFPKCRALCQPSTRSWFQIADLVPSVMSGANLCLLEGSGVWWDGGLLL